MSGETSLFIVLVGMVGIASLPIYLFFEWNNLRRRRIRDERIAEARKQFSSMVLKSNLGDLSSIAQKVAEEVVAQIQTDNPLKREAYIRQNLEVVYALHFVDMNFLDLFQSALRENFDKVRDPKKLKIIDRALVQWKNSKSDSVQILEHKLFELLAEENSERREEFAGALAYIDDNANALRVKKFIATGIRRAVHPEVQRQSA